MKGLFVCPSGGGVPVLVAPRGPVLPGPPLRRRRERVQRLPVLLLLLRRRRHRQRRQPPRVRLRRRPGRPPQVEGVGALPAGPAMHGRPPVVAVDCKEKDGRRVSQSGKLVPDDEWKSGPNKVLVFLQSEATGIIKRDQCLLQIG